PQTPVPGSRSPPAAPSPGLFPAAGAGDSSSLTPNLAFLTPNSHSRFTFSPRSPVSWAVPSCKCWEFQLPDPKFSVSNPKFPFQVHALPPQPRLLGCSQLQVLQVLGIPISNPKLPLQVQVLPPEPRLPGSSQLQQLQVSCSTEEDKFLLLAALLKLRLLRGRALLFVGSLPRAFRLKLFLEQFGIPACTLNPQLPARSRCHVIAQFNRGLYDYIVATDEEGTAEPPRQGTARKGASRKAVPRKGDSRRGQSPRCPQDPEFGVSRGIDFQNVAAVINFDVPNSVETYIHRVGRCVPSGVTRVSPGCHQGPQGAGGVPAWLGNPRGVWVSPM
uniref:RNA helicase n=1 Tax=Cyanoderma ruficeps TaxID=181631 RepID=A0A8C3RGE3_9PASS